MDKDNWIKQQVRTYATFKSFLIVYGIIVATFLIVGFTIS